MELAKSIFGYGTNNWKDIREDISMCEVGIGISIGIGTPFPNVMISMDTKTLGGSGLEGSCVSPMVSYPMAISVNVRDGISIPEVGISISTPLVIEDTASVTSGLVSISHMGRPSRSHMSGVYESVPMDEGVSLSIRGSECGHSQAGDNQKHLHIDGTTHWSSEL